ncbi:unannotated protein [freshwater metagenome]|uniref:Unannotated protein n=1 Tax=freshwater metagenome TaxID=449393 RepID=A0A6J6CT47_9ZZZZ
MMTTPHRRRALVATYGVLAVVGLVTTAYFNRQPLPEGTSYLEGWFANNASTSAAIDLIVMFVAASIFMVGDARRSHVRWPWLYVVFAIPLAIAFTFPLYLAIRSARSGSARIAEDAPPDQPDGRQRTLSS